MNLELVRFRINEVSFTNKTGKFENVGAMKWIKGNRNMNSCADSSRFLREVFEKNNLKDNELLSDMIEIQPRVSPDYVRPPNWDEVWVVPYGANKKIVNEKIVAVGAGRAARMLSQLFYLSTRKGRLTNFMAGHVNIMRIFVMSYWVTKEVSKVYSFTFPWKKNLDDLATVANNLLKIYYDSAGMWIHVYPFHIPQVKSLMIGINPCIFTTMQLTLFMNVLGLKEYSAGQFILLIEGMPP